MEAMRAGDGHTRRLADNKAPTQHRPGPKRSTISAV
jgi:hypothetical protein